MSKKQLIGLGAGVVLLGIASIVAFNLSSNKQDQVTGSKNSTKASSATTDTKTANKSPYAGATLYKIGDTVTYQTQTMRVNSVRTSASISSAYSSPVFADPGTKFITVNLTVTNTTTNPYTFKAFELLDQKDRLFNSYEDTIGNVDDYLDVAQLSPSIPKTGNAVYQVPEDATTYRLGGYFGNTSKLLLVQFQSE